MAVALLTMIPAVHAELGASLTAGRFPLVYGADCSVLLAAVPALRDAAGDAGLLFIDGHEDATTMDRSPDGEAANMEIAVLLGITGEQWPSSLKRAYHALQPGALAMIGPHDDAWRHPIRVGTVADRVFFRHPDEVSARPADVAREAVRSILLHTRRTGGCTSIWMFSTHANSPLVVRLGKCSSREG